jgi:PEGA domain
MQISRRLLAILLCFAVLASAQGNSWNKVRYNGGTVQTKVDPKDWDNHLTVTSDLITLKLKDGQTAEIPTKQVTGLSYGQEAHRRVGTMIGLALISPVALFGLFHKTRLHFIGIEYATSDGKKSGILLQGDKDNYRAILLALHSVTNAPLTVSEKDKEYVPMGISTTVTKDTESSQEGQTKGKSETTSATETGSIVVVSTPDGAEVSVDGAFVGNAPATLKLPAGKHTVKVALAGYKEWTKDLTVLAGSELKLNAALEKQN